MKKKISLPIVIAIALVAAAIAFSLGYIASTESANKKISDLAEKQSMFTNLASVDSYVREKYEGEIDEEKLNQELCKAYADALGKNVLYMSADEYEKSEYAKSNSYQVLTISDSVIIVLTEEQAATPD